MGWFEVVRGHPRSSAMLPFDTAHMISYLSLIEIMHLLCTIFEIRRVICQNSPTLNCADWLLTSQSARQGRGHAGGYRHDNHAGEVAGVRCLNTLTDPTPGLTAVEHQQCITTVYPTRLSEQRWWFRSARRTMAIPTSYDNVIWCGSKGRTTYTKHVTSRVRLNWSDQPNVDVVWHGFACVVTPVTWLRR